MEKQGYIDHLKAFAIILVVFYHAMVTTGMFDSSMFCLCLCMAMEMVHVPLFILIAGFLCRKQPVKTFYIKKCKRILIPFLFMSCLKLLVSNVSSVEFLHLEGIHSQLFETFICGQLYWFCYCMLILFAIAPLLWNRKAVKWCLLMISLGANILIQWNHVEITNILQLSEVIHMMPFFVIGMLLHEYGFPGQMKKMIKYMGILIAAAGMAICGYFRFYRDVNHLFVLDLVFGLSVMYILYVIAEIIHDNIAGRMLKETGKYSLQIMFLDSFFRTLLYWIFGSFMISSIWLVLLITVLDIVLCCLLSKLLEKIPFVSCLFGLNQLK